MDKYIDAQVKEADLMSRAFLNLTKKSEQKSKGALQARLTALETKWSNIQSRHRQMMAEKTEADDSTTYFKEAFIEDYEEIYLVQKAKFLDALDDLILKAPPSAEHAENVEKKSLNRKLPNITLPQFSGKYSDWASFKDMFTAL